MIVLSLSSCLCSDDFLRVIDLFSSSYHRSYFINGVVFCSKLFFKLHPLVSGRIPSLFRPIFKYFSIVDRVVPGMNYLVFVLYLT